MNSIQQGVVGNLGPDGSALYADVLLTGLMVLVGLVCWIALRPVAKAESLDSAVTA